MSTAEQRVKIFLLPLHNLAVSGWIFRPLKKLQQRITKLFRYACHNLRRHRIGKKLNQMQDLSPI